MPTHIPRRPKKNKQKKPQLKIHISPPNVFSFFVRKIQCFLKWHNLNNVQEALWQEKHILIFLLNIYINVYFILYRRSRDWEKRRTSPSEILFVSYFCSPFFRKKKIFLINDKFFYCWHHKKYETFLCLWKFHLVNDAFRHCFYLWYFYVDKIG